jgi:hypothetical protein
MLADRICHVVQSAFDGRRIFIFSDGATAADEAFFTEIRAIRDGGGFGSIIGHNSFLRKKGDALKFLSTAMGITRDCPVNAWQSQPELSPGPRVCWAMQSRLRFDEM